MSNVILDWLITVGVLFGLFLLAYTAYRKQGLLDTVNEFRDMFRDKVDEASEKIIYK